MKRQETEGDASPCPQRLYRLVELTVHKVRYTQTKHKIHENKNLVLLLMMPSEIFFFQEKMLAAPYYAIEMASQFSNGLTPAL